MYVGVELYLAKDIVNVNILNNTCICKTCHCSKCDYEWMFISFKFQKKNEFIIGGIYRHPNGNMKHFVDDLERTLMTINGEASCILARDMNIDIIKFENEGTLKHLTTLFSYRFLPYITLPSRITNFSATCIDHIFVRIADNKRIKSAYIASGLLFNDITDHLPRFISIKCVNHITKMSGPLTRVFGDKNGQRFIERKYVSRKLASTLWTRRWQVLKIYNSYKRKVRNMFPTGTSFKETSKWSALDNEWTKIKHLTISPPVPQYLAKTASCPCMISKYKKYKALLRNCLKVAEQDYFCQLFDDTKQSAYNSWKNLGPVINPDKRKSKEWSIKCALIVDMLL